MKTRTILVAMIILAGAIQTQAGWVIEQNTILPDGKQTNQVLYIQNNKMAMAGDQQVIFNVETQEITVIMPDQGTYMTFPPQMIESMGKMAPEWQGALEIKQTPDADKIAGYLASKYQVLVDGKLVQEVWMAKDLKIGEDLDLQKFAHMSASQAPRSTYQSSHEYQDFMKMGYPLKQVQYQGDGKIIIEVTKIKKEDVPASRFEVPAGLKEVNMQQMMQGH
jgi:hypothetical protein